MDRLLTNTLFVLSLLALCGAVLLLVSGFLEYLQTGNWQSVSLLQLGYDSTLIRARWFITHQWSWWMHEVLLAIPVYAVLLIMAPASWWLSGRFGQR